MFYGCRYIEQVTLLMTGQNEGCQQQICSSLKILLLPMLMLPVKVIYMLPMCFMCINETGSFSITMF